MYADPSTEQDSVVKVGDYEVRVKEVNPNNATKMEMFALMSYLDDQGLTNNQGMKSFNKMTAYATQVVDCKFESYNLIGTILPDSFCFDAQ